MWVRTPTSRNTTISVIRIIKCLPPPLPKGMGVSFKKMDMLPFMKNADEIADEVENEIVNKLQEFVEAMDDTPIEGI